MGDYIKKLKRRIKMEQTKVGNVFIQKRYNKSYSNVLLVLCTIFAVCTFFFIMSLFGICIFGKLAYIVWAISFLAMLTIEVLKHNKKNCEIYEIVDYFGDKEDCVKDGFTVVFENDFYCTARRLI